MADLHLLQEEEFIISSLRGALSRSELREMTNQMIDQIQSLISGCQDSDVIFLPDDPEAYDPAAQDERDLYIAWTLGHVIVHTTASAEESAALAAELARGVPYRGVRSRYEIPWQEMKRISQCQERLEESRRMRLASLDMWPDRPHLTNSYKNSWFPGPINATVQYLLGIRHEYTHLEQIAEIINQSRKALDL